MSKTIIHGVRKFKAPNGVDSGFHLQVYDNPRVIVVTDISLGMSVTNAAEVIFRHVRQELGSRWLDNAIYLEHYHDPERYDLVQFTSHLETYEPLSAVWTHIENALVHALIHAEVEVRLRDEG